MTVAVRGLFEPRRTVLPMTVGSLPSALVQKLCVNTTTGAALGPSSVASIRRPRTGRKPITSKNEPPTTPERTTRGSPRPTIVKLMVEKSPIAFMVFNRERRSMSSGIENVILSTAMPGALWRM
jgi:hypothetical protein